MKHYAGIDMSSRSCHICVIDDNQHVHIDEKVPNNFPDIWKLLAPFDGRISAVVEASFNWYWLVDQLIDFDVPITLAHATHIKAITHAKIKTDRRDARWLAELLRVNLIPGSHICPLPLRRLRDMCRLRFRMAERKGNTLRQLRQVITNEGYHSVEKTILAQLDVDGLDIDTSVKNICHIQQDIQGAYESAIEGCDQHIITGLNDLPEIQAQVNRLRQVPGFGPVNSATVVFESGDPTRFKNHKPYISYSRLTPGLYQSGEKTKEGRKRKAGNEHLKRAYTCAAVVAPRSSVRVRAFREKHLLRRSSQSNRNIVVNSIVAHKLATGVFYMLTRNESWQEDRLFPC